jgi:hypothetical protein
MADLPPVSRAFLQILAAGALIALAAVILIIAIEAWKTWIASGERQFVTGDYVFFSVLVLLLVGLTWLRRAIMRELRKS